MANRKLAEGIFWFQVIGGVVFGLGQGVRMMTSTQGVSTTMFAATEIFCIINLILAVAARKAIRVRATGQTLVMYIMGLVIYSGLLAIMLVKGQSRWDGKDWLTSFLVGAGLVLLFGVARLQTLRFTDPMIRGGFALIMKAVPQLVMAVKIWQVGGGGIATTMIVMFHLLTCSRILQVYLAVQEVGWDRNLKGILLSESGNELSWCAVTAAWLAV